MKKWIYVVWLLVGSCAVNVQATELFSCDFEKSDPLSDYKFLDFPDVNAEIVKDSDSGKRLKISTNQPSQSCGLKINRPFTFEEDLVLSFDVKTQSAGGKEIQYIAVSLQGENDVQFFDKTAADAKEFRHVEFAFSQFKQTSGASGIGLLINSISIYARGAEPMSMAMYMDNIRLEQKMPVQQTDTNPPFFNWKRMGPVVLEYSKDINFSKDVTKINTEYNFCTPREFLTPGQWYWRVCKDGKCDFTRCTVIPEKTHRFICPPIDEKFVLSKPRPWLVSPKKLSDEQKAALRAEYQTIIEWKVPSDSPAYNPASGLDKLQWTSRFPNALVMPTGKRLQRMAEIYAQLKDDDIRDTLYRWIDEILLWDPHGASSAEMSDIPAYHILRGLNYSYDILYNSMPPDKKKQLRDRIITRAEGFEELLGNPFPVGTHKEYNNHAWLKGLVLCESGMILLGDYDGAYAWAEYAKELLVGKFLCVLGYQGENNEGLAYGTYGGMFLVDYAGLIRQVSGVNLFKHPWLEQAGRFYIYCAPKNAWGVSFADTGSPNHYYNASKINFLEATKDFKYPWIAKPVLKNTEIFTRKLSEECGNPYGMWYSCSYEDPAIAPRPPVDMEQSVHYEYIGWAVLNTNLVDGYDGVTFAMHSGPYWGAHQHADQNGFVINAYGSKLAIDSGYYDFYGSEHFKAYSTQTKAHNAILIDGQGQAWTTIGADGKITAYFDSPFNSMVIGDASDPDIYRGRLDKWLRKVIFIKPHFVVIYDDLMAPGPSEYEWLLHTVAPIEIHDNKFSFTSGDAALKGTFLRPENVLLTQTKGYPVQPGTHEYHPIKPEDIVDEWTLNAKFQSRQNDVRFLTVMQIDRTDSKAGDAQIVQMQNDKLITLSISSEGMRHFVCFNETGGLVSVAGASTDSDAMVLSIGESNQLKNFAIYGGTHLKYEGNTLFETADNVKIDIACQKQDGGDVFDISTPKDCGLLIKSDKPEKMLIDGQKGVMADKIAVTKGSHTIALGEESQKLLGHPIQSLDFNGTSLSGYKTRSANQRNYYWWGRFRCDRRQLYTLKCNSSNKADNVRVYIDDDSVDPSGLKPFGLEKGIHFIQISSSAGIDSVEFLKKECVLETEN